MRSALLAGTGLIVALLTSVASAGDGAKGQQYEQLRRNSLKGATAVVVDTTWRNPTQPILADMSAKDMANLVALELRKHKVPILMRPPNNERQTLTSLILVVDVNQGSTVETGAGPKMTVFSIELQARQGVGLLRDSNIKTVATTWQSASFIGLAVSGTTATRDQTKHMLTTMAQQFAADFLAANEQ